MSHRDQHVWCVSWETDDSSCGYYGDRHGCKIDDRAPHRKHVCMCGESRLGFVAEGPVHPPAECGTPAGYQRHRREEGTPVKCVRCVDAETRAAEHRRRQRELGAA